MLSMTSPTLRRLCLAATVCHFLPGAHAVLRWRDGSQRDVGPHPCCDVDACGWRDAVIQSAATASLLPHELLFGLAGAPAVDVLPGCGQTDMGGGVYRCDGVDVFFTSLDAPQVHEAVAGCEAPGRASIGVRRDDLLGVTMVAVGHLVEPIPADGRLAWALAMACAVREVSYTGA
ncbi:MAG: hypothetical protein JWO68_288 [Actinomycetia bacterium]|nr:hypothetical protein [Actinomycetes bacterium]